jgi:2-enoate reductase
LFTPWKIRDLTIKNRIVMTSMGGTSIFGWMEPNHFDKEAANFLLERAKNNVGLILPGIAPIKDPLLGRWLYQNKGMFRKLKKYMEEFHKTGAKMFVQLTAGFGRSFAITKDMEKIATNKFLNVLVKPILNVDYLCAAPSVLPNRWSDKVYSKALTVKQINKMIEAFAKTAKLCQEAGVDGIEIHAVHEGYLLDQFTLKYTNLRKDEYGGSFENRYRFPVEIVKAIKKVCGENYPVSLRYSVVSKTKGFREGALPGETYTEVGRDLKESEKAARYLEDAGYDMLNCDNGTYDAWYWAHPPGYMPVNTNLAEVSHIKKFVSIPVVCAGRMDPLDAARAIENDDIDAMGVARQFLVDPEWVTKLMNSELDEIMPCICCHNACFTMAHYKGVANDQDLSDAIHMSRCALNPTTMQTNKYKIVKTKKSKRIAIIGGGVGGMEAARILTLRGHNVTIYEKTNQLGGIFVDAAKVSFKEKDRELIAWYVKQMKDLAIDIKFETEIKDLSSLNADEVIVATGAQPRVLHVKGYEKAVEACEYLGNHKQVGETVIVVGGGLTGCEIAYDLFLKGKKPIIVEMQNDLIAAKGVCLANSSYLRDFFKLHKVPVYLETKVLEIDDNGVIASTSDGKTITIPSDSVIMSAGYTPAPLFKETKHIHLVGDCYNVGNLRTVIWRAWDVAMKI